MRFSDVHRSLPVDKFNLADWEAISRYGKSRMPLAASRVFWGLITRFSKKSVVPEKWVVVNDGAGTMTFVNTYDGKTGANFDQDAATFPLDLKRLDAKTEGMELVDVDLCPVAVSLVVAKELGIMSPESVPVDNY